MSYLKPRNLERLMELQEGLPGDWGKDAEEKERIQDALEECRWSTDPQQQINTILDILQSLVRGRD